MKSYAYAAVDQGLAVFPCYPRSKIPACPHGSRDAVTDRAGVDRLFTHQRFNMAMATGARSGRFVVDVDGPEGFRSLRALEAAHGLLPATQTVLTARGAHFHLAHPGRHVRQSHDRLGQGIDIRGDGSSVILPPSVHESGYRYRWDDPRAPLAVAPGWLVEEVTRAPEARAERFLPGARTSRWSEDEVHRMLAALPASACDGRDTWLKVGMALHAAGFGFEMWDEWSRQSKAYQPGCTATAWRGFRDGGVSMGSLVHMAQLNGWKPERTRPIQEQSRSNRSR